MFIGFCACVSCFCFLSISCFGRRFCTSTPTVRKPQKTDWCSLYLDMCRMATKKKHTPGGNVVESVAIAIGRTCSSARAYDHALYTRVSHSLCRCSRGISPTAAARAAAAAVVVVAVVVVLALPRIITSMVARQAPVNLEWKNSGKK